MRVAIIGAGISGLSTAQMLKERCEVTLFEKSDRPGGLIQCRRVAGSLFHTCGGHVFNSKNQEVLDWFWSKFVREEEFAKADRNACVFLDRAPHEVPYPIENHVYLFDGEFQRSFQADLEEIDRVKGLEARFTDYDNFGDFLRWRFGKTLYQLYFEPYNRKVWRRDLTQVPMSWMEGKLPMPTTQEMRDNNANHVEEKSFVHATFWYEKQQGSQFIVDRLAQGLDIRYGVQIGRLERVAGKWLVEGEVFDRVIYCGNIKDLPRLLGEEVIGAYSRDIEALEYHGTTAVFCEIDANPYSWVYQPSERHDSHRIICTGNFAASNNRDGLAAQGRITGTIEFTDAITKEEILEQLKRIPLHPQYLDHQYNQYTYPIQDVHTRDLIRSIKGQLAPLEFYMTGRFADWEYYNMDVAIGAAMKLCQSL